MKIKVKLNRTLFINGIRFKAAESGTDIPLQYINEMLEKKSFPRGMCVLVGRRWKPVYVTPEGKNKAEFQEKLVKQAIDEAHKNLVDQSEEEAEEKTSSAKEALKERKESNDLDLFDK